MRLHESHTPGLLSTIAVVDYHMFQYLTLYSNVSYPFVGCQQSSVGNTELVSLSNDGDSVLSWLTLVKNGKAFSKQAILLVCSDQDMKYMRSFVLRLI